MQPHSRITLGVLCALLLSSALFGQASGTVVVSPPTPGKFVATAGAVSCTVTGNTVAATAVTVACTVGGATIPPYSIPLPATSAYTFQQNYGGDAVTVALQADSAGKISWQAVATPGTGTTSGNVTGTF